jgi:hypothetical protein
MKHSNEIIKEIERKVVGERVGRKRHATDIIEQSQKPD